MGIASLHVEHFRNICDAQFEFSERFNLFYGDNGSGKTSLLEAIYVLAHGKSFRANHLNHLIQHHEESCLVNINFHYAGSLIPIGFSRARSGARQVRLNQEKVRSIAEVTKLLPIQFMSPHSHRLLTDGPKARRQYLDWGLFHVKHDFHSLWQDWQKCLKQRNAALKAKLSPADIQLWDEQLCDLSNRLDRMRVDYLQQLSQIVNTLLQQVLAEQSEAIRLVYHRGWSEDADLKQVLQEELYRDMALGYTYSGPQRADCQLYFEDITANHHLSQGQQKLAAYTLLLAQGMLLKEASGTAPIYLIDDLPSELDPTKRAQIAELLHSINSQVFITGISQTELQSFINSDNSAVFNCHHLNRIAICEG